MMSKPSRMDYPFPKMNVQAIVSSRPPSRDLTVLQNREIPDQVRDDIFTLHRHFSERILSVFLGRHSLFLTEVFYEIVEGFEVSQHQGRLIQRQGAGAVAFGLAGVGMTLQEQAGQTLREPGSGEVFCVGSTTSR